MKIKLPAALKKIPPIGWVVVAGVLLAVLYLKFGKGSGASVGVVGGGGGGGSLAGDSPNNTVGTPAGGSPDVQTPGGTQSPLAGLPGARQVDVSGLYGGEALLARYPSLGQFPTDKYGTINYGSVEGIPGLSDVNAATASWWADKLGGNYANVGNPDPAEFLAQWLYHEEHGLQGTALEQRDLESGLAYAWNYAKAAGVSSDELATAQAKIAAQGGIEGSSGFDPQKAISSFLQNAGLSTVQQLGAPPNNAAEYIASLRAVDPNKLWAGSPGSGATYGQLADALSQNWGVSYGTNPTPSGVPGSPTVGTGGTYDVQSAGRIAQLQQAIATQTRNIGVYEALTSLSSQQQQALATNKATIAKQQAELSALLSPTKAF